MVSVLFRLILEGFSGFCNVSVGSGLFLWFWYGPVDFGKLFMVSVTVRLSWHVYLVSVMFRLILECFSGFWNAPVGSVRFLWFL